MMNDVNLKLKVINLCISGPTWTILDAVASKKCNKVNIEWAWTVVVGSMLAPVAPILTGKLSVFNPVNVHCKNGARADNISII